MVRAPPSALAIAGPPSRSANPSAPDGATAAPLLRLLAYHVLILVGAAGLLLGVVRSGVALELVGAAFLSVGVALQLSIIVGSARSARAAGAAHDAIGPLRGGPGRRRCTACGWNGVTASIFCARCHRATIPDLYVPSGA